MQVIVNYLDGDGGSSVKRYAMELVAALAAEGVDVHPRAVAAASFGRRSRGAEIGINGMHNLWPIWRRGLVHAADHRSNPVFTPAKVVTIHDISPVVHPAWGASDGEARLMDKAVGRALRTAHVVTPNAVVRQQLIDRYDGRPERITTVPLGVRQDIFHPEPLPAAFVPFNEGKLTVVTFMDLTPRDRVDLLLEAAVRLPFVHIIHAGRLPPTPSAPDLAEAAWQADRTLQAQGRLSRIDRVDDATRRRLFSSADVVVHASLADGFSGHPLEALRCGARLMVTDTAAHREALGETARYFAPEVERLADALSAVWNGGDVRDDRFAALDTRLAQAALYTWARTGRMMIAVYESIR